MKNFNIISNKQLKKSKKKNFDYKTKLNYAKQRGKINNLKFKSLLSHNVTLHEIDEREDSKNNDVIQNDTSDEINKLNKKRRSLLLKWDYDNPCDK